MYGMESLNFSIFAMILTAIIFFVLCNLAENFDYEDFVHRWLGRISAFVVTFYAGVNFQCLYNGLSWISPWNFFCGNFYHSELHVSCASMVFATMMFFALLGATYSLLAEAGIKGGIGILFLLATMVYVPLTVIADSFFLLAINIRWLAIVIGVIAALPCVGFAVCCIARICNNIIYDRKIRMRG